MTTAKSTDEWFTPKEIIDALGDFDLDPCAPLEPRKGFKCKTYFENNLKD